DIEPRFRDAFAAMPPLAFPGVPANELAGRELDWWRQVVRAAFGAIRFADFDAFFRDLFSAFARADAWELFPDVRLTLQALQTRGPPGCAPCSSGATRPPRFPLNRYTISASCFQRSELPETAPLAMPGAARLEASPPRFECSL